MPDYAALPLSRVEYNTKNHPAHGDDHGAGHGDNSHGSDDGHGHDDHATEGEGHTSIMQNALRTGGLS